MRLRDVVDQFQNEDGFSNTCTAEQANFPTFSVWGEEIDDFDPRFKNFDFGRLLLKGRGSAVDWHCFLSAHRSAVVYRFAYYIQDPSEAFWANRHRNGATRIAHFH